jgi:uncharacterized protein YbjT (DUF2867 family)
MILVIGATGTIGSSLVPALLARDERVRVVSRDAERARGLFGDSIEVVQGDLTDPTVVSEAVQGVDKVFLNTSSLDGFVPLQSAVIDAAAAAGVSHLVRLSVLGADPQSGISYSRGHAALDEHLKASGLTWTLLAPGGFMQNLLSNAATIKDGSIYASAGDGAISFIDARDIADAAAAVLTSDGHAGHTYTLTGGSAVTFAQIADAFAAELGHPVTYVDVPSEVTRQNLLGYGLPEGQVDDIVQLFDVFRAGYASTVTTGVAELLGREPRTLAEFVHDHRAAVEA